MLVEFVLKIVGLSTEEVFVFFGIIMLVYKEEMWLGCNIFK